MVIRRMSLKHKKVCIIGWYEQVQDTEKLNSAQDTIVGIMHEANEDYNAQARYLQNDEDKSEH